MLISTLQFDSRQHPLFDPAQALVAAYRALSARQLDESDRLCQLVLQHEPEQPDALHFLGLAAHLREQLSIAEQYFRRAIARRPADAEIRSNFSVILADLHRMEDALAVAREAVNLAPEAGLILNQYGHLLCRVGQFEAALPYLERAVERQPSHTDPRLNLALCLLTLGDLPRGFAQNERRPTRPHFPGLPEWTGDDLGGRTVLLIPEQGFGEIIHFVRYFELVEARGGRVIFWAPEELASLLRRNFPSCRILVDIRELAGADLWYPLLSLPHCFGTTLDTIPARVPYLAADPAKAARWRARLASDPKPKIGLVWAGGVKHRNDYDRTLPFPTLALLLALDRFSFYSLQKGPSSVQAAGTPIIDLTADLTDFDETAALMENLDLVLTVDTSVAHLAGAMGKPTWTMIQYAPDFRWLRHRADSPWYPTLTLFRQPTFGDWPGLVAEVSAHLVEWAGARAR